MRTIVDAIPAKDQRQTLLFSATLTEVPQSLLSLSHAHSLMNMIN
jgi:superfamily II DNA/RNA helicase